MGFTALAFPTWPWHIAKEGEISEAPGSLGEPGLKAPASRHTFFKCWSLTWSKRFLMVFAHLGPWSSWSCRKALEASQFLDQHQGSFKQIQLTPFIFTMRLTYPHVLPWSHGHRLLRLGTHAWHQGTNANWSNEPDRVPWAPHVPRTTATLQLAIDGWCDEVNLLATSRLPWQGAKSMSPEVKNCAA